MFYEFGRRLATSAARPTPGPTHAARHNDTTAPHGHPRWCYILCAACLEPGTPVRLTRPASRPWLQASPRVGVSREPKPRDTTPRVQVSCLGCRPLVSQRVCGITAQSPSPPPGVRASCAQGTVNLSRAPVSGPRITLHCILCPTFERTVSAAAPSTELAGVTPAARPAPRVGHRRPKTEPIAKWISPPRVAINNTEGNVPHKARQ